MVVDYYCSLVKSAWLLDSELSACLINPLRPELIF